MISSQKRQWVTVGRLDSRLLLRGLIAFNIVLAVYNILTLQSNTRTNKSGPCVVVINTSKDTQNAQAQKSIAKSESQSSSMNTEVMPINRDVELTGHNDKLLEHENSKILQPIDETINNNNNNNDNNKNSNNNKETIWWSTEARGSYSVLINYVLSDEKPDYEKSVTLTTQGTYEFLYHVEFLCNRWDGHVSVAVYCPGDDFKLVINLIYYLRQCKQSCVKTNTTWHLVYDTAFGPESNSSFPHTYIDDMYFDCSKSFDSIVEKFDTTFRTKHSLPYPINVVRNVARLNVRTRHLFASDIELYPSVGIVSGFLKLLEREKAGLVPLINEKNPHVYVIPIFEVKAGIDPPLNKSELRRLIKSGNAIFFHKWVCDACQNFPDRNEWINVDPANDTLGIFRVTRRLHNRNTWEPLYIGTNAEPLYDERLTWDGKRDKMSQMFEMCLMNYDLGILDNAFLVHAPGIKRIDPKDEKKRLPFIKRNNMVYNTIMAKLRKKYGTKNNC